MIKKENKYVHRAARVQNIIILTQDKINKHFISVFFFNLYCGSSFHRNDTQLKMIYIRVKVRLSNLCGNKRN